MDAFLNCSDVMTGCLQRYAIWWHYLCKSAVKLKNLTAEERGSYKTLAKRILGNKVMKDIIQKLK
jgi:hypothetical protein